MAGPLANAITAWLRETFEPVTKTEYVQALTKQLDEWSDAIRNNKPAGPIAKGITAWLRQRFDLPPGDKETGDKVIGWLQSSADWLLANNLQWRALDKGLNTVRGFLEGKPTDSTQLIIDELSVLPIPTTQILTQVLAALTGKPIPSTQEDILRELRTLVSDPKAYLMNVALELGTNPQMIEVQQTLGAILVDIVLTPLEATLDQGIEDPKLFTRQFHGALASLTLAGHALSLAAEITGLGQIHEVGRAISDLYYNFGLGFMGWQTISPLLDIGIKEAGGRYYNRRYHPRRWTVSELMELYALNEITAAQFNSEMDNQGYRAQDTALALKLAQQRISVGDVIEAYQFGKLTVAQAISKIREKGFALEDARFLINLEQTKRAQSQLDSLVGVGRTAFKKSLIAEGRFRQMMAAAQYAPERIDLEVQVAKLAMETDTRDLTISQVEAAFKENILTQQDSIHYLQVAKVDAEAIPILIQTWQAQMAPDPLKLNTSTLSTAYQDAVLTRTQLVDKLKALGYGTGDAEIVAEIADAAIARRKLAEAKAATRRIGVSEIGDALKAGVITAAQASDLLVSLGMSVSETAIVLATWQAVPPPTRRQVSQAAVTTAYELGILERDVAKSWLVELGFSEDDAELLLQISDERIAEREAEPPPAEYKAVTLSILRQAFVYGVIDEATLRTKLADIKVDAETINILVATWQAQRVEAPTRLSASAILAAYQYALITRSQAAAQLQSTGLSNADTDVLLRMAERAVAERYPHPTGEAVLAAYANKILTYDEALKQLRAIGYGDAEASLLLRSYQVRPQVKLKMITETTVIKLVKLGVIDLDEAVRRLELLNYSAEDAELVLIANLTETKTTTEAA